MRSTIPILAALFALACVPRHEPWTAWPTTSREDLRSHFEDSGHAGGMIVVDHARGEVIVIGSEWVDRDFLPASTFKIPHALIALETGALASAEEVIPWDGTERDIAPWNADHTLATAICESVVPFFQETARRIGRERMQAALDGFAYGNRDISGPIDTFWLDGALRISPREQVAFLERFTSGEVAIAPRNAAAVRAALIREVGAGYVLHAKTGWAARGAPDVGWFVGWVERREGRATFALVMERSPAHPRFLEARVDVARTILADLGIVPKVVSSPRP